MHIITTAGLSIATLCSSRQRAPRSSRAEMLTAFGQSTLNNPAHAACTKTAHHSCRAELPTGVAAADGLPLCAPPRTQPACHKEREAYLGTHCAASRLASHLGVHVLRDCIHSRNASPCSVAHGSVHRLQVYVLRHTLRYTACKSML